MSITKGRLRTSEPSSSGGNSRIGQSRYQLYKSIWARISQARANDFWLECIVLCESVMADRLEALLYQLQGQQKNGRIVRTATQTANSLIKRADVSEELRCLCESVIAWSRKRNLAVHEMAKVIQGDNRTFDEKLEALTTTGQDGVALARMTCKLIAPVNKSLAIAGDKRKTQKNAGSRKPNLSSRIRSVSSSQDDGSRFIID